MAIAFGIVGRLRPPPAGLDRQRVRSCRASAVLLETGVDGGGLLGGTADRMHGEVGLGVGSGW